MSVDLVSEHQTDHLMDISMESIKQFENACPMDRQGHRFYSTSNGHQRSSLFSPLLKIMDARTLGRMDAWTHGSTDAGKHGHTEAGTY